MNYHVLGGDPFEAATPLDVAEALRQQAMAWAPSVSIEDFMEGMAHRAAMHAGRPVRADTPENFVADLVEVGILTPVG